MLKKSITYTDFDGQKQTEDFYFHLSKADLVEMQLSKQGGLEEWIRRIVATEDGAAIVAEFKKLLAMAVGQKSPDGKRFLKNDTIRADFEASPAYSDLFMELVTDADKASEFVNGIIPDGLAGDIEEVIKRGDQTGGRPEVSGSPPVVENARVLTPEEARAMDHNELSSGLATGRYKLGGGNLA